MLKQCSKTLESLQKEVLMTSDKKSQKSKLAALEVRIYMNNKYTELTHNKTLTCKTN